MGWYVAFKTYRSGIRTSYLMITNQRYKPLHYRCTITRIKIIQGTKDSFRFFKEALLDLLREYDIISLVFSINSYFCILQLAGKFIYLDQK